MLTDGIGDGWRTGAVTRVLAAWARHTPVALVNLLPQRLWHWSRSRRRAGCGLRAASPGVPNARLQVRTEAGLSIKDDSAVPIPVLGLEPEWWSAWARLIGVPGAGWVDTTAVFVEPDAVVEEPVVEPDSPAAEIPAAGTGAAIPHLRVRAGLSVGRPARRRAVVDAHDKARAKGAAAERGPFRDRGGSARRVAQENAAEA